MDHSTLEEIGFTPSEIKVYEALLRLGDSKSGPIIREAELPGSVVYRALDKLEKKGLVGFSVINRVKHFTAVPPARIVEYVDEKKEEVSRLAEEMGKTIPVRSTQITSVFQGFRGFKSVWNDTLTAAKKGDAICVLGAGPRNREFELYFRKYHQKRIKAGIIYKIIYNMDALHVARFRKKSELVEIRIMPQGFESPVWFGTYGDKAVIGILTKEPTMVVINDKRIVESFKQYFNFFWKISEKYAEPTEKKTTSR